ncbi:MAG: glycoside hydrolase family 127 protein [Deltaproteobacteria bacterium]|nr:glycoside hydrolase family 127 protein [Deltaproteobacteria bacterium]
MLHWKDNRFLSLIGDVSLYNRLAISLLLILFVTLHIFSCLPVKNQDRSFNTGSYMITPVDLRNVKLTDRFWLPIVQRIQEKTIPYALEKCRNEGRLDNFLIAGGHMEGSVKGKMPFDDTDVYKIIEGASISLISAPNPELEKELDNMIEIIGKGQEADGYLTTWRTINPNKPPSPWVKAIEGRRWESLEASHELYNAGHLYEAAYAHHKATGKENFLKIVYRNADLIVKTFGSEEGQIAAVPGHQIIETGLIKLYFASGKEEYLRLAKYFLDNRGNPEHHKLNDNFLSAAYSQDHLPVIEQDEVVGHAVRAMYMYAAMTDIAVLMKDAAYEKAVDKLWQNMVEKKIYLTGGIGARHEGEAFGENYELPNLTAYNETCAAIGSVYWNHRLHCKTGRVQYLDVMERTLYNGLLSGLSLDGTHFFYPNPLESDGEYAFNQGAHTRKDWFDCSCCPTNLIRFIPSVAGLLYSTSGNTLYINLYASSEARVPLENTLLEIQQETPYPWSGVVNIRVSSTQDSPAILKLRIPYWARNTVLPGDLYTYLEEKAHSPIIRVNGEEIKPSVKDGYIVLERTWKEDEVSLEFPMTPRKVVADYRVAEDLGKTALEYGPLVYAFEWIDQQEALDRLGIASSEIFTPKMENELLGGVVTLSNENAKAVPYYTWSNRGIGKMKVWIPLNKE